MIVTSEILDTNSKRCCHTEEFNLSNRTRVPMHCVALFQPCTYSFLLAPISRLPVHAQHDSKRHRPRLPAQCATAADLDRYPWSQTRWLKFCNDFLLVPGGPLVPVMACHFCTRGRPWALCKLDREDSRSRDLSGAPWIIMMITCVDNVLMRSTPGGALISARIMTSSSLSQSPVSR